MNETISENSEKTEKSGASEKTDVPIRWRAVDDSRLVWRQWEEDEEMGADPLSVVYFLDSDDTHLMNDIGAEIIRQLQNKALSLDELMDALSDECSEEGSDEHSEGRSDESLSKSELRNVIPPVLIERFVRQMALSGLIYETME